MKYATAAQSFSTFFRTAVEASLMCASGLHPAATGGYSLSPGHSTVFFGLQGKGARALTLHERP